MLTLQLQLLLILIVLSLRLLILVVLLLLHQVDLARLYLQLLLPDAPFPIAPPQDALPLGALPLGALLPGAPILDVLVLKLRPQLRRAPALKQVVFVILLPWLV